MSGNLLISHAIVPNNNWAVVSFMQPWPGQQEDTALVRAMQHHATLHFVTIMDEVGIELGIILQVPIRNQHLEDWPLRTILKPK